MSAQVALSSAAEKGTWRYRVSLHVSDRRRGYQRRSLLKSRTTRANRQTSFKFPGANCRVRRWAHMPLLNTERLGAFDRGECESPGN